MPWKTERTTWRIRRGVLTVLAAAWLMLGVGVPQAGARQYTEPGQSGFQPVTPGQLQEEQLPAAPLVFVAYSVVWVVFMGYAYSIWRRIGRVERELADLRARYGQERR